MGENEVAIGGHAGLSRFGLEGKSDVGQDVEEVAILCLDQFGDLVELGERVSAAQAPGARRPRRC